MKALAKQLRQQVWSLVVARTIADEVLGSRAALRALIGELFGEDVEVRKRAADVTRRITDWDGSMLRPYADELAGS